MTRAVATRIRSRTSHLRLLRGSSWTKLQALCFHGKALSAKEAVDIRGVGKGEAGGAVAPPPTFFTRGSSAHFYTRIRYMYIMCIKIYCLKIYHRCPVII